MIQFSIFGIPVSIQPFFWVTMALLGGAFSADTTEEILSLALFILAGFVSILVHELGHALTIKSYRVPTSITLQAFGGYATYPSGVLNRRQSFLVTAGGPALQLVLALVAHILIEKIPALRENPGANDFLSGVRYISIFWAILNLLPVVPLDGGQLVNSVLGPARIKITLWITIVTAVVIGLAMYLLFKSILFPILLGTFAYQAFQGLKENSWR